jgi:uncharacterized MAPEG superfamily protein
MTIELWCLVAVAMWTIVLNYVPLLGRMMAQGIVPGSKWGFGNRAESPAGPLWVQRADRAHKNHLENFPVFIVLVVALQFSGHRDASTALACEIFVAARVAHSIIYMLGIVLLRTLVYWTGLGAMLWLLYKLF